VKDNKVFRVHIFGVAGPTTEYIDADKFSVGRSAKADLKLNLEGLSRIHFSVEKRANEIFISDNKSANGTHIKGRKVPPGLAVSYKPRSEIKIGHNNEVISIDLIDGLLDAKYLESLGQSLPPLVAEELSIEDEIGREIPTLKKLAQKTEESDPPSMATDVPDYITEKNVFSQTAPPLLDEVRPNLAAEKLLVESKLQADIYFNEVKSKADRILNSAYERAKHVKDEYQENCKNIIEDAKESAREIKKRNKDKVEEFIGQKKAEISELKQKTKEEVRGIYVDAEKRKESAEERIEKIASERDEIKNEMQVLIKDIDENKQYYVKVEEKIRSIEKEKRERENFLTELKMKVVEGQAELQRKKDLLELEVSRHKAELAQLDAEAKMNSMRDELLLEQIHTQRKQAESDIQGLRAEREKCEVIIRSIEDLKKQDEDLKGIVANAKNEKAVITSELNKIIENKKILQSELDTFQQLVEENRRELAGQKEASVKEIREMRIAGEDEIRKNKELADRELDNKKLASEEELQEIKKLYLSEEKRIEKLLKEAQEKMTLERSGFQEKMALKNSEFQDDLLFKRSELQNEMALKKSELQEEIILLKTNAENEINQEKCHAEEINRKLHELANEEISTQRELANKEITTQRELAQQKLDEELKSFEGKLAEIKSAIAEKNIFLKDIDENIERESCKRRQSCDEEIAEREKKFQEEQERSTQKLQERQLEVEKEIQLARSKIREEENVFFKEMAEKKRVFESDLLELDKESKNKINREQIEFEKILAKNKNDAEVAAHEIVEKARELANITMLKTKKKSSKILYDGEQLHLKKEQGLARELSEIGEMRTQTEIKVKQKMDSAESESEKILEQAESEKQEVLAEAAMILEQSKIDRERSVKEIEQHKQSELAQQSQRVDDWENEFTERKKQMEREHAATQLKVLDEEAQKRLKKSKEFEVKLKHDGNIIAKNLENIINIKIKNYLGLKDSNLDIQAPQLQESLNELNKDIKSVINAVVRGESLEGNDALKNLMQFNPKSIDKMKKFYTKVGLAVGLPIVLLLLGAIFPNLYSSMRMGLVSFLAPEQSMSDLYAKKMADERESRPKFNPPLTASFKGTYSDNILYTKGFLETKLDGDYQDKFTIALNQFILDELQLNEETVISFISLEIKVIQDLMESRESIFFEKQVEGIAKLKKIEGDWMPEVITLLKTEQNYIRLFDFQKNFYTQYKLHHPPVERTPASDEVTGADE